jgi:hypothetical protein
LGMATPCVKLLMERAPQQLLVKCKKKPKAGSIAHATLATLGTLWWCL